METGNGHSMGKLVEILTVPWHRVHAPDISLKAKHPFEGGISILDLVFMVRQDSVAPFELIPVFSPVPSFTRVLVS